jgi:hypothetical protein
MSVRCLEGREVRVDCAAAGMNCRVAGDATVVGDCEAPVPRRGRECRDDDEPWCAHDHIRYCFAGEMRSFACADAALDRCSKVDGAVRCAEPR